MLAKAAFSTTKDGRWPEETSPSVKGEIDELISTLCLRMTMTCQPNNPDKSKNIRF